MNNKQTRLAMSATRAVGPQTVIMDRPPDMTIALGSAQLEELQIAAGRREARPKTPSMMVTSIFRAKPKARSSAEPVISRPSLAIVPPAMPCETVARAPALAEPLEPIDLVPRSLPAPGGLVPQMPPRAPLRTRMVNLRDALAQPPPPPLPTHLAQAPVSHAPPAFPPGFTPRSATMPIGMGASAPPWKQWPWKQCLHARWPLFALAALALLLLLIIPSLGNEGTQAQVGDEQVRNAASRNASSAADSRATKTPIGTDALSPNTTGAEEMVMPARTITSTASVTSESSAVNAESPSEAKAGAMLLSGRRAEALTMYRVLAARPDANEAIEAMVVVLEQKVNQP